MRKLLNRKIVEQAGKCAVCHHDFVTVLTSYPTTETPKEWEARGGMTTRKTSKPYIGGATQKKDRADWVTDDRSAPGMRAG